MLNNACFESTDRWWWLFDNFKLFTFSEMDEILFPTQNSLSDNDDVDLKFFNTATESRKDSETSDTAEGNGNDADNKDGKADADADGDSGEPSQKKLKTKKELEEEERERMQ